MEILSVRERQRSYQSASISARPPSEAFAWLAGGDAATATCTEVRVVRGAVPHILGKNGRIIKAIEEFTGVLVGIQDLDKSHALVSLFGPPTSNPRAKMIVGCLSRGDFVDFRTIRDLLILGLLILFAIFLLSHLLLCWVFPFSFRSVLVAFCWLYMVELSWSSVAFLYIVWHGVDLDFISFLLSGGSGVLSH